MSRGTGAHSFQGPLVGRAAELSQLCELYESAANADPRVAVIGGEAGIGKSRLVSEFLGRLDSQALALVSRCVELGPDGPPFAPFSLLLRGLIADVGRAQVTRWAGAGAADLALLAPELGPAKTDDALGRGRLFEAVATLLEHAGEQRPTVVVLEDLHWSDSATRDLIGFLIRTVSVSRVLFVLTYRTDELPRRHPLLPWIGEIDRLPNATRISLGRLAGNDVDELVRSLGGEMPARTGARIRERSEGIPFFVEELTSCCSSELGGGVIPDSLRGLMLTRLERLSEPSRAVVRMASAANTQVDHEVLMRVAGMAESALDDALREAVGGSVLVVDDTRLGYSFRHALMREAVHEDLLPGEHARLHASYAAALEVGARPEQAGEIAHHWNSAHETAKSFEWSLRAADHSRSVYAWQEELQHLERALDLWDRIDDPVDRAGVTRADLLERAGRAAGDLGQIDKAVAYYDAALADVSETTDPQRAANLLIQRAGQCQAPRASPLPDLAHALDLAAVGSVDRAAALSETAIQYMVMGRLDEAEKWAREAIDAATAAQAPALLGQAHNTLGCVLFHTGGDTTGFEHLQKARDLALQSDDWPGLLRYYGNTSDALIGSGDFTEAVRLAHRGRAMAAERGWNRTMGAFLGGNEVEALTWAGRWDEALVTIDDVLRLDPTPVTQAHILMLRAMIRLRRGDVAGGADDLEASSGRIGRSGTQPQYLLPVTALRAAFDAVDHRWQDALERLLSGQADAGGSPPTSSGWPFAFSWARILDEALQAPDLVARTDDDLLGRNLFALHSLAAYLASVSSSRGYRALLAAQLQHLEQQWAQRVAGRDGPEAASRGSAAQPDWANAVSEMTAAEGLRYELAYARLRLADQLFAAGDRSTGRELLLAAWGTIEELRAESLRGMAAHTAAAARIPLRPVQHGSDLLTAREREVLELVAQGRSNRAISEELFISIKTTSVHVSHILAKIGATSRTEAAAWAHENAVSLQRAGQAAAEV